MNIRPTFTSNENELKVDHGLKCKTEIHLLEKYRIKS